MATNRPTHLNVVLTEPSTAKRKSKSIVLSFRDTTRAALRASINEQLPRLKPDFTEAALVEILDDRELKEFMAKANRTPGRRFDSEEPWKLKPIHSFSQARAEYDEHDQITTRYIGAPGLKPLFPAVDGVPHTYTAQNAGAAQKYMSDFHRSLHGLQAQMMNADLARPAHVLGDPQAEALDNAHVFADPGTQVILAQPDFTQMLLAAAQSAPENPLQKHELISPNGVLYFAQPQDLTHMLKMDGWLTRAIYWKSVRSLEGEHVIVHFLIEGPELLDELRRGTEVFPDRDPAALERRAMDHNLGPVEMFKALTTVEIIDVRLDQALGEDAGRLAYGLGLIRSIGAIARSAHTVTALVDSETPKQRKIRLKKKQKKVPAPQCVQVLSLLHAQYGRYELDAATGRTMRAHWVRGHWRNQWYPSEKVNRIIWIDGFVKGTGGPDEAVPHAAQTVYDTKLPRRMREEHNTDDA